VIARLYTQPPAARNPTPRDIGRGALPITQYFKNVNASALEKTTILILLNKAEN
jgi:hypothetical protein